MVSTAERYGWAIAFAVLIALAVPWFMWGDGRLAFGLPLWLWWHVAWMVLAAGVFWLFATRAWGIGVVGAARASADDRGANAPDEDVNEAGAAGESATERGDETAGNRGGVR